MIEGKDAPPEISGVHFSPTRYSTLTPLSSFVYFKLSQAHGVESYTLSPLKLLTDVLTRSELPSSGESELVFTFFCFCFSFFSLYEPVDVY